MSSSLADLSIAANVAPHVGSDVTRLPSGEYVNTCACARDLGRDMAFASTTISGPSQPRPGYLHSVGASIHDGGCTTRPWSGFGSGFGTGARGLGLYTKQGGGDAGRGAVYISSKSSRVSSCGTVT